MKIFNPCTSPTLVFGQAGCNVLPTPVTSYSATLTAKGRTPVTLPVTTAPGGNLQVSIAGLTIKRGIWKLRVATATCCAFYANVFIDECSPPIIPGTHHATAGGPNAEVTVCC